MLNSQSRLLSWILLGVVLQLIAAGCSSNPGDRYDYHVSLRSGSFGSDGRITATVLPGRIATCSTDEENDVCVYASAPMPIVRLANDRPEPVTINLTVQNVSTDAHFAARLGALGDDETTDQECASDTDLDVVALAPVVGNELALTVPGCSAVELKQVPDPDRSSWNLALVGTFSGSRASLELLVESIASSDAAPDFILFAGGLTVQDQGDDPAVFAELVADSQVPLGYMLVGNKSQDGATDAYRDWADVVGALDYAVTIGASRLVMLDSASSTWSEESFSVLEDVYDCDVSTEDDACPEGLLVSHTPVFGPGRADRFALRSPFLAQEGIAAMQERGLSTMVASNYGARDRTTFAGIRGYQLPEAGSGWLLATFVLAGDEAELCVDTFRASAANAGCDDGEACLGGLCRLVCDEDSGACDGAGYCTDAGFCGLECTESPGCDGSNERCVDGLCSSAPQIETTWQQL